MRFPICLLMLCLCASVNAQTSQSAVPPRSSPPQPASSLSLPMLPLPASIQSGDTIELDCGRTYRGPLLLTGLTGVSVRTRGDCGLASLTTAIPVSGWQRDPKRAAVWVARLDVMPTQLQLDTRFMALAHHPNTPGTWLTGDSIVAGQLRTRLPSADLGGATLIWRAADWLIETRRILRYDGQTMTIAPAGSDSFGLPAHPAFYVEGKRWMLDSPGEWVYEAGQLSLWTPDGRSPEGRVWASPEARAIDARDSRDLRIDSVRIVGATLGIDASGSRGMQLTDVVIENSGEAAIMAGSAMRVLRATVRGSVQDGLRGAYDASDVQVLDSRFDDIGMLGMPRRSRGAIVFEQAQRVIVQRNRVRNAAYLGIRVFRHALVSDNEVVRACLRLDDCAGIYTFARDRLPLHVSIEGNRVSRLAGSQAYAIYLDDFANGVRVLNNQLIDNPGGMQLHNGFDNEIVGNAFINSQRQHLLFNETAEGPSITGNLVARNRFVSVGYVPVYRLWSHHGDRHVDRFAEFRDNRYRNAPLRFAEVEGRGALALDQWFAGIGAGDEAASKERAATTHDADFVDGANRANRTNRMDSTDRTNRTNAAAGHSHPVSSRAQPPGSARAVGRPPP